MSIIRNVHSSRSQDPRLSGQNGLCHMSRGTTCPSEHCITLLSWLECGRRREMIFLCEELLAEGFPAEREFARIITWLVSL
jgi:hypothetical protein